MIPPRIVRMLERLKSAPKGADFEAALRGHNNAPAAKRLRARQNASPQSVEKIWDRLRADTPVTQSEQDELCDPLSLERTQTYTANIENYIGTLKIPLGIVGPIRINGLHANGDFFTPLATTEAALIASYARGADLTAKAGGISTALLSDSLVRGPAFIFKDILESGHFVAWVAENTAALRAQAETTTRYGKLVAIEPFIDSDTVFLLCRYETGDAAGQNMVTVATQALCEYLVETCPIRPIHWFIEANFSGDKKATFLGMHGGRGRKVTASIEIPENLIRRYLHTDSKTLLRYCRAANLGAMLSGQLGVQAHYANALAAFYIATGQDAACVSESAVGITRIEPRDDGIFMSCTLPNIIVGSVGGGTGLPSQSAALSVVGLKGEGKAAALAEVTAALCLCGELSILGAIAAGHFTRAHSKLARNR